MKLITGIYIFKIILPGKLCYTIINNIIQYIEYLVGTAWL